jgi:riboflavin kinase/FMN adenylyltransferase
MVIFPDDHGLQLLNTLEEKIEIFRQFGIQHLIIQPFTLEFSKLSPEEFLENWLFLSLNPRQLIVGYDFAFGADRKGTLHKLKEICTKSNVDLEIIPPFEKHNMIVSSSKIREFIRRGEMVQAQEFLGRPYYLKGTVTRGDQRGRTIGFPTANLDIAWKLKPRVGVYATRSLVRGKEWLSMTNVGWNPTVSDNKKHVKVETHLFNFDEEIYGEEVQLKFYKFLREECKFKSLEDLKKQLVIDQQNSLEFFNAKN